MHDLLKIITIDGPSGVGKSTVSRRLAACLGFAYLDTGAMYRVVALKCKQMRVSPDNERAVESVLDNLNMKLLSAPSENEDIQVLLDDVDVTAEIRSPELSMLASTVSAHPAVRKKLTIMQQQIGEKGDIVAEGRDMGTVVFPSASWKFYLDASPEERARRRVNQLQEKGVNIKEDEILEQIVQRDTGDQRRTIAPLKAAQDAVIINSTHYSVDEVIEQMLSVIQK
jgi:cytidylate kinase